MYLYTDMKGKSCQYSTDSLIMFWGGAKYITKSQVRYSTVIIIDFNTLGKCVFNVGLTDTNGVNNVFFFY